MKINILLFIAITAITAYLTTIIDHNMNRPILADIPQEIIKDLKEKPTPAFTFTDSEGTQHHINDFKGKIVLLNFWASWCAPCLKEFPSFIKIANQYPDEIIIIALSSDTTAKNMNRFLDKMKEENQGSFPAPNFFTAFDKDTAISQNIFSAVKLPETIIINKQGQMTQKILGANWHIKQLEKKIDDLK